MIAVYILAALIAAAIVIITRQAKIYNKANSIYYKQGAKEKLNLLYNAQLNDFTVDFKERYADTIYGRVHIIECGSREGENLVMFHAASVGSVSWKKNVKALGEKYHIYLIDTLGEGNKSELYDVENYPKTSEEVSELYKSVLDALGIEKTHIAGASYGGFLCLNLAYHMPERVDKIVLIGSMGVAPSVPKVIMKLTLYSFFPYKALRKNMARWAFGEGLGLDDARQYFSQVLSGVLGRYYAPKTVPCDMLSHIENKTLIILGARDNLVGNPEKVKAHTKCMKNAEYAVIESGHLINSEKAEETNRLILDFIS